MKEKDIQRETSQIVEDVLEKANLKQDLSLFWAFLLVK